jgi:hypothetical protein
MLLKNEFYHMVNHLGLEDGELSLAEIVWEKAERAMQGKPVQEAKLLKSTAFERSTDPYVLTQAELQSLTVGLAQVLTHEQQVLQNLKHRIDNCWRKSEPDNAETEVHFTRMNELRNYQRKIKKDHVMLSRIQYKLKRQQGK